MQATPSRLRYDADELYILTSDGHVGVIVSETKNFIDAEVLFGASDNFPAMVLELRFSKRTLRQRGTQHRSFTSVSLSELN